MINKLSYNVYLNELGLEEKFVINKVLKLLF